MNEFQKIKSSKVVRAIAVGGAGCLIATIAPLGVAAVVAITAGTAAASWAVDSVGDEIKKKKGK